MSESTVPRLRIADFDGEWLELTLGEVSRRTNTKNRDRTIKETFTNSAQYGIISQLDYFDNSVSNPENIGGYYVVEPDDFVYNPRISTLAPYGPVNRNKLGRRGAMSPLYSVFRPSGVDCSFLEYFFKTDLWHEFMRMNGDTGARHDRFAIGAADFYQLSISRPSIEEQRAIGSFFTHFDSLISQHQSKHERLEQTKRALMQRMFPEADADEPELRFEGFTGPWETRNWGSLGSVLRHNSLARADLTTEDTGIRNVHYGDVLTEFRSVLNPSVDNIPFARSTMKGKLGDPLQDGDIIFADAAEDETVGKCCELRNTKGKLIVPGLHTIPVRPTIRFAEGFLAYALNAEAFHDQLIPLMQGSKVSSISATALSRCELSFPSFAEQQAIGAIFGKLDDLISTERNYIDKLQQVKSGLLQNMYI